MDNGGKSSSMALQSAGIKLAAAGGNDGHRPVDQVRWTSRKRALVGDSLLGFDNAHDYHHRHYMREVAAVEFTSYDATLEKFQQEWLEIVKGKRGKKS